MCVAHRKAPLALLCFPAVSVLGPSRGTRIPERDLALGDSPCARLHIGSVNRDQSQYGESQEVEASPRPPWTRLGRHASEAQPLGGGRLRPAGATCCLRPREAAKSRCSLLRRRLPTSDFTSTSDFDSPPCRLGSVPTEFLDLAARLVPQRSPGSTICTRPTGLVQSLVNLVQKPPDTIQKNPFQALGKFAGGIPVGTLQLKISLHGTFPWKYNPPAEI